MNHISRREFLSGAAALGLGGWRLFAAPPGWKHGGTPNLVFGVVSDTHLRTANKGNGIGANWPDKYFAAALEYFKPCGIVGDRPRETLVNGAFHGVERLR